MPEGNGAIRTASGGTIATMDALLNEEQRMLAKSLRAFVEQELRPHEAAVDRAGEVPAELGRHIVKRALELGLYAPNIPEEFGGGGLDAVGLAVLEREFGRTSFGLHGYVHRPSEI